MVVDTCVDEDELKALKESLQMSPAFRRAARRENWRDGGESREGAAGGGNGLMK